MSKLDLFVSSLATNIRQHTSEWFAARAKCVGGSTISAYTGTSPFNTPQSLKVERSMRKYNCYDTPTTSVATYWGTLFETVGRNYVSSVVESPIKYHDIFVPPSITHPHLCYSPDGFYEKDNKVVLVELKSPYKRIPFEENAPEMYKDQLRLGLSLMDVADEGLLAETVFRICYPCSVTSRTDIINLQNQSQINLNIDKALVGGFIIFDSTTKDTNNLYRSFEDVSLYDEADLCKLLVLVNKGCLCPNYSNLFTFPIKLDKYKSDVESMINDKSSAILHYKLMKYVTHKVFRQANFLDKIEPIINESFSDGNITPP